MFLLSGAPVPLVPFSRSKTPQHQAFSTARPCAIWDGEDAVTPGARSKLFLLRVGKACGSLWRFGGSQGSGEGGCGRRAGSIMLHFLQWVQLDCSVVFFFALDRNIFFFTQSGAAAVDWNGVIIYYNAGNLKFVCSLQATFQ